MSSTSRPERRAGPTATNMKKTIAFSVQHPWLVLGMSIMLVVGGLWSAMRLPLDAVPDITDTQVQVLTYVRDYRRSR